MLRERYGLDKPIHVRYVIWLGEVLRGNLGYSYSTERPISEMIAEVLPATLLLQASSIGMALLFGIVLGVMSALKQYSVVDHVLTFVALFGISVPSFFIALIAMYVFAVKLGWLPIAGMWTVGEPRGFNLDLLRHMILPSMAGGIVHIASFVRYTRASMLDALSGDYVVTARAKGLPGMAGDPATYAAECPYAFGHYHRPQPASPAGGARSSLKRFSVGMAWACWATEPS